MITKALSPFLYAVSVFSILAIATPCDGGGGAPPGGPPTVTVTDVVPTATSISQCNTGDAQCCNRVETADEPDASNLLEDLGVVVGNPSRILVGLGCTPITVIGIGGGANCVAEPVCCGNNNFAGLINIGCTPISL